MSEAVRARERLEFEEAAAAVQREKLGNERQVGSQLLKDLSAVSGLQFTAGGVEVCIEVEDLVAVIKLVMCLP